MKDASWADAARRVLRFCLGAWPRDARRRHEPAMLDAFVDELLEGPATKLGRLRWLVGECAGVLAAGLKMRARHLARATTTQGMALAGDLQFAVRTLSRSPGFTVVAVLTLAVGIGANAAVFGLVDQILFRSASYAAPSELVLIWNKLGREPGRVRVAAPDVAAFRDRARLFEGFAFTNGVTDASIEAEMGVEHVRVTEVTPNFFHLLGVSPALGRSFGAPEGPSPPAGTGPSSPPSIVLGHGIWQSAFGGDASVVGRTVRLSGRRAAVVGVMPRGFRLQLPPDAGVATDIDVWVPLSTPLSVFQRAEGRRVDQDSDNTGAVIGRMRPGVSLAEAREEMGAIGAQLRSEVLAYATADLRVDVRPLRADATAHASGLLRALLAGGAVVLLVACLNLSTLVLARGIRRRKELAIRLALGAGRGAILRQLATETLLLVAVGVALAAIVAAVVSDVLTLSLPPTLAPFAPFAWSPEVLGLAGLMAGLSAFVFGFLPGLGSVVREGQGRVGSGALRGGAAGSRFRSVLVVTEVALSLVLVLSAGFLMRTAGELRDVKPGFLPEGVLTFSLSLRVPGRYEGPAERARLMREVETAVGSLPGVRAVGLITGLPLGGERWIQPYGFPGQAEHEWEANRADFRSVTAGYFDALGVPLLAGRTFAREEDLNEERRVVVVDERLAGRIAPGGSAVGLTIGFPLDGDPVWGEVVGVVGGVRHEDLRSDGREALYVPYRQEASRDVSFVVRSDRDPAGLVPAIRRTLQETDRQIPVYAMRTMTDYIDAAVAPTRFLLTLISGFAILALLAVAIGLYGVVAYEVGQRTRDIGLRLAVGASRGEILRSVLTRGLRLGGAGVGLGVFLAAAASHGLRPIVYGVELADWGTWALVLFTVFLVTVLACVVPALKASRLDPRVALRSE